ncbi:MAG: diguanylate cyclase/phosphodiesterase (GGDEF & EAL domains) with PAS/PAC sensor(s) [Firmicutes bacterium]|nr:diguanylate cyclase/phosphodiesterase (GGDEF & EAL domains) with PAS/PAC sensor(s) [Bacillota bacterium]
MIDNERVGIYGIYTDITARKQAERALAESEERYRKLVEFLPDAIIVHRESKIEYSNMAALQLLGGKTQQEIQGLHITRLIHPDYAETARVRLTAVLRDKAYMPMTEYKIVRLDGTVVDVEISATWLSYRGEDAVLSVIRDITERKKAQETINNLAYYDTLTGLPNRTLFQECFAIELAHAKRNNAPLAVMFLDLDKFKNVNDTLGHGAGDKLLKAIAERLQKTVRVTDTVSRMSGDEFILVLSELNMVEDVVNVAQKVLDAFQQPFIVDNNEFYTTISIGISLFPQDGTEVEALVKNADAAMYKAKEIGGNNYQFFTPNINETIIERQNLFNRLRKALNNKEFEVHYQPRVNLKTGNITGTEALLRWRRPDRGIILPAEFIPIAEETGLIVPIGEWVLRTACAKNKSWQEQGLVPLRVSVNLSAKQVQMQSFVMTVDRILKETGLDPMYLELEITESAVIQNMDLTLKVLSQLKDMGVYISIDDFGTGYSCLSRLKRMNVDMLKVDQTFIREVMNDKNDYAIVSSIITMAHNMDMVVTAEGVDKEEQLNILNSLNCDDMQGYLYSKPLTEEEFLRFMVETGK